MARRYDSSTTTFSPEGRLHQVEYAIEAINNAGTSVGILAKDGVVMASEKKITSGLLAQSRVRRGRAVLDRRAARPLSPRGIACWLSLRPSLVASRAAPQ